MLKKNTLIALSGFIALGFTACDSGNKFKKTEGGLEYKIVKDVEGDQYPKTGDIVGLYITTRVGDSVMF